MSVNILRIAAPMTLALLINVCCSIVDLIYIGHMPKGGTLALAGRAKLIDIADEYAEIGTAFCKAEETPAKSAAESSAAEQAEEISAEADITSADSPEAEESPENITEEA